MRSKPLMMASCALLLAVVLVQSGCGGPGVEASTQVDWPMYRGSLAGTGYSPLTQITAENVADLTLGWRYSLRANEAAASAGAGQARPREPNSQATPIVVGDVMYLPTVDRVVALDPTTGEEIWSHFVTDGAPSRRGLAYWPGEDGTPARIIFTASRRLVALDAATGMPATAFGQSGEIDMVIPYNSVPLVYENIIVVGANTPRGAIGGIGNARAFDARTGAKVWEFSSVPQPGSLGHDTWEGDSWQGRLGANAWPFYFTLDEERGHLYVPLASPIPFGFGGDREGANLFANSLVAVDIRTGEYVWHFQTIHHDLWDHDPPAPPVLFDAPLDGGTVAALGVTTKSGYLYILDRDSGEPIFEIEERPVPQSDVPGEVAYATQPIPVNPPALARVSYDAADLVTAEDTSPEHAAACAELVETVGGIYNDGAFTPWAYRANPASGRTTLLFPGLVGGPNWGGAAFDPNSGYILVFSQDIGALGWMEDAPEGSLLPYQRRGPRPSTFDVRIGDSRLPCQKPPWARLSAVDASTGDVVWQQPVGITAELPAGRQNTGRPGRAGAIVTGSGLVFVAATDDNRLRALDVTTGQELWVSVMDRRGNANPMTYLGADGNQYLVVAATDAVVAYRLP